ncbi:hypothetical protein SAMN05444377_11578 [Flavobacterium fontis]|uniref:Uncharacterized protein n=1 Tax=Flavobacterium fontis TaxID=1124188 RepID=A0A1M5DM23_9FLAO|nr:hypothetical protein [Flavobacterium fontis]SHF67822.1 hypothetical protein SAMN05444377_11578 [Flavobacterium fontis]
MSRKIYHRHNFHKHTFCVFQEVDVALIKGMQPDYTSASGSSYYFTEAGVYRYSNHWGRAANCKWRLTSLQSSRYSGSVLGYANWSDFLPDNEIEKLYAIEIDFAHRTAQYHHKLSKEFPENTVFRTAPETLKRLKVIRQHLKEEAWLQYFEGDPTEMRQHILTLWNTGTESLEIIKRRFL